MKNLILAAMTTLVLVACGKNDNQEHDYKAWQGGAPLSRAKDGVAIPTATILDCRKITDAENVHYYYSVVANPTPAKVEETDGKKVTTYSQADLQISASSENYFDKSGGTGVYKALVYVSVDLQIVEDMKNKTTNYLVHTNESSADDFKTYFKSNPYFNTHKAGDELMTLVEFGGLMINQTVLDLPGLTQGDTLECRTK